ncbi:hypothetical protein [Desulfonatronum thioautotrophicum]|uniref:hypothetical protein n=1 Tax=Desulfonatronum thioautotrophicum TaxID=617001 RepID=UPI0005EBC5F9|nr:hypothetical protein [Desulfonatronum thioautotrophicum]
MPDTQEGTPPPLESFDNASGEVAPVTHSEPSFGTKQPQKQPQKQPLMLVVPWLHLEMEPVALPAEALFFDPGLHPLAGPDNGMVNDSRRVPGRWRPVAVPLSEGMATAFLREATVFAREHGAGRAMLSANALTGNDFYAGSALSIQSELTGGTPSRDNPAVRYQQLLLLAWQMEEQDLELRKLQHLIDTGWQKLDSALGVEDSEGINGFSEDRSPVISANRETVVPWRLVLEAMLFFAPQGTLLVTSHREIIESLEDVPDDPMESFTGDFAQALSHIRAKAVRMVRAPGWKLIGATRCPAGKPWLERVFFLACLQNDESGTGSDSSGRA